MDWNAAIERHRNALKRVLATLAALAGFAGPHPEPVEGSGQGTRQGEAEALALHGEGGTLPRHLHRAVLRLLRPAEAAARRLIIVAARELLRTEPFPPPSRALPSTPPPASQVEDGCTTARVADGRQVSRPAHPLPHRRGGEVAREARRRGGEPRSRIALPLFDPLRCLPNKRLRASATAMPRISIPGWSEPAPLPQPPTPYDPIDATRLTLRLAALARALDDLPREARRFARWHGRVAAGAQNDKTNGAGVQHDEPRHAGTRQRTHVRRTWPLRGGRPPGSPSGRSSLHAVHQIQEDVHGLAFWVLEAPDTS
ncbi:MAG: hypothetical protein JJ913_17335 [Rhizobiaceae bacterium]|nr:hypothetical protein [Rhizobiaceae bacterium]